MSRHLTSAGIVVGLAAKESIKDEDGLDSLRGSQEGGGTHSIEGR